MLTKEELPECPVATTVSLIGSKWKLLIIRNLLQCPWRFNELKKILKGSARKFLLTVYAPWKMTDSSFTLFTQRFHPELNIVSVNFVLL